ncbi:hypothetical protein CEXT_53421 [Caerostris extrusa]|uniref:Uncharacterized protein n=1 Tax=Caerostris extrusa TaxID=172846 RepID=A0AAV4UQZ8_CAEEX|nr:hypothetical protein CEXT_53421 [Caerostris extrusa]
MCHVHVNLDENCDKFEFQLGKKEWNGMECFVRRRAFCLSGLRLFWTQSFNCRNDLRDSCYAKVGKARQMKQPLNWSKATAEEDLPPPTAISKKKETSKGRRGMGISTANLRIDDLEQTPLGMVAPLID